MAGFFLKLCKADIKIKPTELNFTAHIFALFYITGQKSNYDAIFGQDLMRELRITYDFQLDFVNWTETKIPINQLIVKQGQILQFNKVKILRMQI